MTITTPTKTRRIKLLTSYVTEHDSYKSGDIIEVPDTEADARIANGEALELDRFETATYAAREQATRKGNK